MKLSDSIREGAKKRPQCYGVLFLHHTDPSNLSGVTESCTIGAGLEGAGFLDPEKLTYPCKPDMDIETRFEGDWTVVADCLAPSCIGRLSVLLMIGHLNDHHRYHREWIADWLKRLGY